MADDEIPEMELVKTDGGFVENTNMYDILLKLKCGQAFDNLTKEDIEILEGTYIKDKDDIIITKDEDGSVYVLGLYVGEKAIDVIQFQLKCEKQFKRVVKKYREDSNEW